MSFSKARIQRFNECDNNVPPPGAYDPKFDTKVKGPVIEKTERFQDDKSVHSAECNLSDLTKSSKNVVTTFRTPQCPRKKNSSRPTPKLKPRAIISNDLKLKYELDHHLADLTVECSNKNKTIQEQEKCIEEMKEEVQRLELQLKDLHTKQAELEEQHRKDIETMVKLHQEVLNEHNEKYEAKTKDLQKLYKDVNNRLREAQKELEDSDRKHQLALQKQMEDLADMIKVHEEEKMKLEQQLEDTRLEYLKEIENLSLARDREVAELKEAAVNKITRETRLVKDHADKMIENAEAVTRETLAACRAESDERVRRVIAESDAKVNAMVREAKATAEEEMRLTAERYKACIARVEMERTALDEKLAQKDAEIAMLSVTLEELKSSAETQESFGQSLQMGLDRAETELAEKKEELRALKDQIRSEAAEMVARRKRFEVIMAENQASVGALTKRLAQSNAEVDRLQHELKRGEDCIHEQRDLLSITRNNSQMVREQVHALMEQLDAKAGILDQLEADSLKEVESIKSVFEAKIEDIKQIASKEVSKLQADCDVKNAQNAEMRKQLSEMASRLSEAQDMLLKLEEMNDAQALEVSRVELINSKLNEQMKVNTAAMEKVNKLLEAQSAKHTVALSEANSKLEEERNKWKTFEKAIIQELQEEKVRREAAEEKVKKVTEHNERLTKEFQEISEKYAEIVGHQNHRQRIKHVSQLKDKVSQLEQDLRAKQKIMEQQQKMIEKSKVEEKRAHGKGKENMLAIPKSAHTTPVSSPHKPMAPLRSRND